MAGTNESTKRITMTWIDELQNIKKKKGTKSQYGESEIIKIIFQNIPPTQKFFVDIGAGYYGNGIMSNTNELIDEGWEGIQIDANNSDNPNIKKLFVTPENIVPFLKENEVPHGFDLLTIDIDSFDLDILEKVVPEYRPRVICTEFNPAIDPSSSCKLKYEEGYVWDKTTKYGYSFGAGVKFCNNHGYKIILNHIDQNLFLVRGDLIGEPPLIKARQVFYHPVNTKAEWVNY
jgi:hypothetical protein